MKVAKRLHILRIHEPPGRPRLAGKIGALAVVKPCQKHDMSAFKHLLVISVSTGGKSPGLARRLRRHLEGLFGPEWAGRLDEVGRQRRIWRAEGLELAEIGRRVDAYIEEKGWLS